MSKKGIAGSVAFFAMVFWGVSFAESVFDKDLHSLLSAFTSYTDLRMISAQQSLEILASSSEAQSGNWENIKGILSRYQKSDDSMVAWYLRPDGQYYTVEKGLMDQKLNERSYFQDLIAGRNVLGALVISKSTGQRSAVVAVPIKDGAKVVGAMGVSIYLDKLSAQIESALALRPGLSFFALNPEGLTALHRNKDRHFLDPRDMGSETLKKATDEMLSKNSGGATYVFDNVTKKAIYQTSSLTYWKFAIAFVLRPAK